MPTNPFLKAGQAVLRWLFMLFVAYPMVLLGLGLRVRHRERLPATGPAIVVANHNSHLDFMVLLALFPFLSVPRVRPAAAADYFCRFKWFEWLARNFVGIIPIERGGARKGEADPLEECYRALEAGQILFLFPEGTRGQPEHLAELKPGVWHLAQRFPEVPIVPVYLHGLGRALPRGRTIPVPFQVKVAVGRPVPLLPDKAAFLASLRSTFEHLRGKTALPDAEKEEAWFGEEEDLNEPAKDVSC
ncbi:lysophospholipid acyltransferase family protein [Hymenobacter psychrophilus]|uniref:1-acyl-sn-glycerol-3-phosphate acyltransferases n=1 Tax=Hymenobacter psychrophilus TaxID=651662 RepID=A0A1H3JIC9_9BACT|nr:lysophospholipid acyltransferase family protein [Hymenobacter psychrophilus]SDY38984.1 1-acyl-sn-glycerol-3-phosphate acyltransferases [Hymenobacter psychrophilus]